MSRAIAARAGSLTTAALNRDRSPSDEIQDGVPEELHALVVIGDSVFVRVGLVRQGLLEEAGVAELVSDPLLNIRKKRHITSGIF
jgi:hypothetical protein